MRKPSKRGLRLISFSIAVSLIFIGFLSCLFFSNPSLRFGFEQEWNKRVREGRRILGWEKSEIPPEEKQIRDEVILKKMREANSNQDWRPFAAEYPHLKKVGPLTGEEKNKALRNSKEFKELDKELQEYLKKKEDLFRLEPPAPSFKDGTPPIPTKDRGAEKVIERLLSKKAESSPEKPLEANLLLGIRGPVATRKIVERPPTPQVMVKVEGEVELTFWVLPDGMVDRVVPTMKGDTELERIAVQYLRQWRFTPLSKDQPQVEQWGVIPLKFKLQ